MHSNRPASGLEMGISHPAQARDVARIVIEELRHCFARLLQRALRTCDLDQSQHHRFGKADAARLPERV